MNEAIENIKLRNAYWQILRKQNVDVCERKKLVLSKYPLKTIENYKDPEIISAIQYETLRWKNKIRKAEKRLNDPESTKAEDKKWNRHKAQIVQHNLAKIPENDKSAVLTRIYKRGELWTELRKSGKSIDDRINIILQNFPLDTDNLFEINSWNRKIQVARYKESHPDQIMLNLKTYAETPHGKYHRMLASNKSRKTTSFPNGIPILLTKDEIMDIFACKCYYCDSPGPVGIDRIDSTKCYQSDNVLPCCITCNWMKSYLDISTFVTKCVYITKTHSQIYCEDYSVLNSNTNSLLTIPIKFDKYVRSAKIRNLQFSLSVEDASLLFSNSCFYCSIMPNNPQDDKNNFNGIDRYDNNKHYTLENSVSCCKACNIMKNDMNVDDFFNKCFLITQKIYSDKTQKIKLTHKNKLTLDEISVT